MPNWNDAASIARWAAAQKEEQRKKAEAEQREEQRARQQQQAARQQQQAQRQPPTWQRPTQGPQPQVARPGQIGPAPQRGYDPRFDDPDAGRPRQQQARRPDPAASVRLLPSGVQVGQTVGMSADLDVAPDIISSMRQPTVTAPTMTPQRVAPIRPGPQPQQWAAWRDPATQREIAPAPEKPAATLWSPDWQESAPVRYWDDQMREIWQPRPDTPMPTMQSAGGSVRSAWENAQQMAAAGLGDIGKTRELQALAGYTGGILGGMGATWDALHAAAPESTPQGTVLSGLEKGAGTVGAGFQFIDNTVKSQPIPMLGNRSIGEAVGIMGEGVRADVTDIWNALQTGRPHTQYADLWQAINAFDKARPAWTGDVQRDSDIQMALLNSYSGPKAIEQTYNVLTQKDQMVAAMRQQAEQAIADGDMLAAADYGKRADDLERKTPKQIVDENTDIVSDLVLSMLVDPTNLIGWGFDALKLGTTGRRITKALSATTRTAEQVTPELARAVRAAEGIADTSGLFGSRKVGMLPALLLNNESRAQIDAANLFNAAAQVLADVRRPEDAKALLDVLTSQPAQLIDGVRGLAGMQESWNASGAVQYGAGLFGRKVQEAMPALLEARNTLLNLPALQAKQLNKAELLGQVADALMGSAKRVYGLADWDTPLATRSTRIADAGEGLKYVQYLDEQGNVISQGRRMTTVEASKEAAKVNSWIKSGRTEDPWVSFVRTPDRLMRGFMSSLYMNLTPGHWMRNAASAVGHMMVDNNFTMESATKLAGELSAKFGGALPEQWMMEAFQGAQPVVGTGIRQAASGLASPSGSVWDFLGKNNPLSRLDRKGAEMWTGGGAIGEASYRMKTYAVPFRRYFSEQWRKKTQNDLTPYLLKAGLDPVSAQNVVDLVIERGIHGARGDVLPAVRAAVAGVQKPLTLRTLGIAEGAMSPDTYSKVAIALEDWSVGKPLEVVQEAINTAFDDERMLFARVLADTPPQPGRHTFTDLENVQDYAEIIRDVENAAKKSGADPAAASAQVREMVERYKDLDKNAYQNLLDEAAQAPTPQARALLMDTWMQVYDLKTQARAKQGELARAAMAEPTLWASYPNEVSVVWDGFFRAQEQIFGRALGAMPQAKAGQYTAQSSAWDLLDRLVGQDAKKLARQMEKIPTGMNEEYQKIIDAGRGFQDKAAATMYTVAQRYGDDIDAFDQVVSAEIDVRRASSAAAAELAEIRNKYGMPPSDLDAYRQETSQLWRDYWYATSARYHAASTSIVVDWAKQNLANATWFDPFPGQFYTLIEPIDVPGVGKGWKVADDSGQLYPHPIMEGNVPESAREAWYSAMQRQDELEAAARQTVADVHRTTPDPAPQYRTNTPSPTTLPGEQPPGAAVPFVFTNQMRSQMRGLGYSEADIGAMSPADAQRIIQSWQAENIREIPRPTTLPGEQPPAAPVPQAPTTLPGQRPPAAPVTPGQPPTRPGEVTASGATIADVDLIPETPRPTTLPSEQPTVAPENVVRPVPQPATLPGQQPRMRSTGDPSQDVDFYGDMQTRNADALAQAEASARLLRPDQYVSTATTPMEAGDVAIVKATGQQVTVSKLSESGGYYFVKDAKGQTKRFKSSSLAAVPKEQPPMAATVDEGMAMAAGVEPKAADAITGVQPAPVRAAPTWTPTTPAEKRYAAAVEKARTDLLETIANRQPGDEIYLTPQRRVEMNGKEYLIGAAEIRSGMNIEPVPGKLNYYRVTEATPPPIVPDDVNIFDFTVPAAKLPDPELPPYTLVPNLKHNFFGLIDNGNQDLYTLISGVGQAAKATGNTVAPTIADMAAFRYDMVDDARRKVLAALANASQAPNTMTEAQKFAAINAVANYMPAWDNVVAGASQAAKDISNFTMLDYAQRGNIDNMLGLLVPYHYWFTRSAKNWVERSVFKPQVLANYFRVQRAVNAENERTNVPMRMQGTVPVPGTDLRMANPYNMLIPYGEIYALSEFADPDQAQGLVPSIMETAKALGFGIHPLYDAAWKMANGRGQEVQAGDFVPQYRYLNYLYQGITGNNLPGAGDEYDPYRTARTLGLMAISGKLDPQTAAWAQDKAYQLVTGQGALPEQPDDQGWQTAFTEAMKAAGMERAIPLIARAFGGAAVYPYSPEEAKAREVQATRRGYGYGPDNQYGSQAAVDAYDAQTGYDTWGMPWRSRSAVVPPALPGEEPKPAPRTYPYQSTYVPTRPGVAAVNAELKDAKASLGKPTWPGDNASREQKAAYYEANEAYKARVADLEAQYPSATKVDPNADFYANMNPDELLASAEQSAPWQAREELAAMKPTWPGDNASRAEKAAYYEANEAYKAALAQRTAEIMADPQALSEMVYGRPVSGSEGAPMPPMGPPMSAGIGQGGPAGLAAFPNAQRTTPLPAFPEPGSTLPGTGPATRTSPAVGTTPIPATATGAGRGTSASAAEWQARKASVYGLFGEEVGGYYETYLSLPKGAARAEYKAQHPELKAVSLYTWNPNEYGQMQQLFGQDAIMQWAMMPPAGQSDEARAARAAYYDAHPVVFNVGAWLYGRPGGEKDPEVADETEVGFSYDFGADYEAAKAMFGDGIWDTVAGYRRGWGKQEKSAYYNAHPELSGFFDWWYQGLGGRQTRAAGVGTGTGRSYGGGYGGGGGGGGYGGGSYRPTIRIEPARIYAQEMQRDLAVPNRYLEAWRPERFDNSWLNAGRLLAPEQLRAWTPPRRG